MPTPPPGGQMSLRLESIRYAKAVGERSVTLSIDGGAPVTMRQGDSVAGIDVQLILPEAVYIGLGGDVIALGDVH